MIKVGLVQSLVSGDLERDLECMNNNVASLALKGCDIIVLPEMFCCPYERGAFERFKQPHGGSIYNSLSNAARQNGIVLVGGSFPLKVDNNIYNACFVFDQLGNEIACHRKVHLFDVDIKGGIRFCESDELTAGSSATVFDTKWGRFGVCICYDWRFCELALKMREMGCDCVFVPAAFNTVTGPLHWRALFKGRSIDNQFFSIGVSPARNPQSKYLSYGHSIAVSPWGKVILELDETPQTAIVDLDFAQIHDVRQQIPVEKHKRKDVYHS